MPVQSGGSSRTATIFREINDCIADMSRGVPVNEEMEVLCECDRLDCTRTIALRMEDYQALRINQLTFIVIPGHEQTGSDRVLAETEGYLVLEKPAAPESRTPN